MVDRALMSGEHASPRAEDADRHPISPDYPLIRVRECSENEGDYLTASATRPRLRTTFGNSFTAPAGEVLCGGGRVPSPGRFWAHPRFRCIMFR